MAFLPAAFDARTVAPATELGALPAGEYLVAITDSALEYTKAGDGQFLKLVFTVLDGPHQHAKVFDRLNIVNRSPTAVEIAQRALSAICHATGVLAIQDSTELHNKPLRIKVSYEPPKDGYSEQNRIKAYKPANETLSPQQVQEAVAAPRYVPNAYEQVKGKRPVTGPAANSNSSASASAGLPKAPAYPWRKSAPPVMGMADASTKKEAIEDDVPF